MKIIKMQTIQKILCLLLTVAMVMTIVPARGFAAGNGYGLPGADASLFGGGIGGMVQHTSPAALGVIVGFAPLEAEVERQVVPYASGLEDLHLPDRLRAVVDGEAEPVPVAVDWAAQPDFDGYAPGDYTFTAAVQEDYDVQAAPPVITVTVQDAPDAQMGIMALAGDVPYYDWNSGTNQLELKHAPAGTVTVLTGTVTALSAGWYIIQGDETFPNRITVTGGVHLILADGSNAKANEGIGVSGAGNSLTIYAQSTGGNIGKLTATGDSGNAGIGGTGGAGGTVTINGGIIEATGGMDGAGIGGGVVGNGGNITISGGTVAATGGRGAAGIGGGNIGAGGNITINGGTVAATVKATGGTGAAGIGGGNLGAGGTIHITNNAVVTVTAGTGTGVRSAIGGGTDNGGGIVTIGTTGTIGANAKITVTAGEIGTNITINFTSGGGWINLPISTPQELAAMAVRVNAGDPAESHTHYTLANNIDLSAYASGTGWTPIGTNANPFRSTFDGGGYTITGLTINTAASNIGLFGVIDGGTVKNLTLENVSITGGDEVGGVAGRVINGGSIEKCSVSGTVSGNNQVGGIAGMVASGGTVAHSFATSTVTGGYQAVGGVAGLVQGGTLSHCFATGAVSGSGNPGSGEVGGVAGTVSAVGSVLYCIALNPSISGALNVGRVAGGDWLGMFPNTFTNNAAFSAMNALNAGFGTITDDRNGADLSADDIIADGTLGGRFTTGDGWTVAPGKLPAFGKTLDIPDHIKYASSAPFGEGSGTQSDPHLIRTAAQLKLMADLINGTTAPAALRSAHYKLMADIDISAYTNWTPIGWYLVRPFTGQFDGNGFTISGLTIASSGDFNLGLFGWIGDDVTDNSGLVKDLTVHVNINITGSGENVGGIAGVVQKGGRIENCSVSGSVAGFDRVGGIAGIVQNGGRIENCSVDGSVAGTSAVGGIAGWVNGTVSRCFAEGTVSATMEDVGGITGLVASNGLVEYCATETSVTGGDNAGGIAGQVVGTVSKCYSLLGVSGGNRLGGIAGSVNGGWVNGGTVEYCYAVHYSATSPALGGASAIHVGGIAGYVDTSGTVRDSYATIGLVSGHQEVGGIAGEVHDDGTVENSVALNPFIDAAALGGSGRITAWTFSDKIANNFGFNEIRTAEGAPVINWLNTGPTNLDGEHATKQDIASPAFWRDKMKWSETVWLFEIGKLPVLRNMDGQSGDMPPHLVQLAGSGETLTITPNAVELAQDTAAQTVDFEVTGMETWTSHRIDFTFTANPANAGITLTSTVNGEGTLTVPAGYVGEITVKARNDSNNKEATAIVSVVPIITTRAIGGVTPPVAGATPVTTVTETPEYTGTVTWSGDPAAFGYGTVYTATITLIPKGNISLNFVTQNFFTVAGATTATNDAKSGVITAVFPATSAPTHGISLNLTGTFTFAGAPLGYSPVAAQSVTVTNNGNQPTGPLTVALSGPDSASFTLSANSITNIAAGATAGFTIKPKDGLSAGTYTATVMVSGGSGNTAQFDISFSVGKGTQNALTIVGGNVIATYGDAPFPLTTSGGTGTGAVTWVSDNPSLVSVNATSGLVTIHGATNAATVTITATKAGGADYNDTSAQITVTVNRAALTVTADDKTRAFGEANPVFTVSYSGFVAGDDEKALTTVPTASAAADATTPAGKVTITVSGGVSDNYNFKYVEGTLTITQAGQAPITVTQGAGLTRTYGDAPFQLTTSGGAGTSAITWASDNPSLVSVDNNGLITLRGATTAPVTITATKAADNNFSASSASIHISVNKKTLHVYAANAQRSFGQSNPPFVITYDGFVNGEDENDLTTKPTASTTATPASPVGSVPIIVSGGASSNYHFVYHNGTLIINKAGNTTFALNNGADVHKTYGDASFMLNTTGAHGPVTWESKNTAVATVNAAGVIAIAGAGQADIYAYDAGNANHEGATAAITLHVAKATPAVTWPNITLNIGQSLNDVLPTSADGVFAWANGTLQPTVADSGVTKYPLTFTPHNANFVSVTNHDMTVVVNAPVNAQAPNITSQPQSGTVIVGAAGATHSLTVAASVTDGGSLSYQWFRNNSATNTGGTAIAGATGAAYAAPIDAVGTFYFYVVVTNTRTGVTGNPTATAASDPVTLTVNDIPIVPTFAVIVHESDATVSGAGCYAAGDEVTVDAGSRFNHTFNGWTVNSGDAVLADANSAATTFTMPAEAVEITANWHRNAVWRPPALTPAALDVSEAAFDKFAPQDIVVTLLPGDFTFSEIRNGNYILIHDKDYSVNQHRFTIKAGYLATLDNGTVTLVFAVSGGANPELTVTITDSAPEEVEPDEPIEEPIEEPVDEPIDEPVEPVDPPEEIGIVIVDGTVVVVIDYESIKQQLAGASDGVTVVVPAGADVAAHAARVEMPLGLIRDMGNMVFTVQFGGISFALPALSVDTEAICAALGAENADDVVFSIVINTVVHVEYSGETVYPPIEFLITATYGDKVVEVNKFSQFVSRTVEISAEQAARITTAVIIIGGEARHVPTRIYQQNGVWYAEINSMSNSVYALIHNPVSFADAAGRWYEGAANEAASRLIMFGEAGNFHGGRAITRAEFADAVVRALGLPVTPGTTAFSDVPLHSPYAASIAAAYAYGIVGGVGNNRFAPDRLILRQEAMVMIRNMARVAGYAGQHGDVYAFGDADQIAHWALNAASWAVGSDMFSGWGGNLHPRNNLTRAETASLVLRLLNLSSLSDTRGNRTATQAAAADAVNALAMLRREDED